MKYSKNILSKIALGVLIGIIISGIIGTQFNSIPPLMNKDEQEFAILAMSLENNPYIVYSPLATGHTTLYFYTILSSFQVFGFNTFGLRIPSALSGIMGGVLFFTLMLLVYHKKGSRYLWLAFVSTLLFITLRWYFSFARFAFEATFLLMFELFSLLFILWYHRSQKIFQLILSGIFAGLAFHSYTPGRIFFLVPLVVLIHELLKVKITRKRLIPSLVFLGTVGFVALPLVLYLSTNTDTRIYQQFFITNEQLSIGLRIQYLLENMFNNFGMLFFRGDVNGIHNYPYKPALNPFVSILFLFGLALSVKNWRNLFNQVFILYFLISMAPTIFTYPWENPHMLRTFTVIPAIVFFCSRSIEFVITKFKSQSQFIMVGVSLLILISAIYEIRTYFLFQSEVFKDVFTHSIHFENYRSKP